MFMNDMTPRFSSAMVWKSGIVLFWIAAMVWLVRFEAFPHRFRRDALSYRDMLSAGPIIMDSWMRILYEGRQIGYTHTRVDTQDRAPLEPYLVQNRTVLDMNLMGQVQTVSVYGEAALDPLYNLQRFTFSMTAPRYIVRIEGRRTGRTTFAGRMWTEGASKRFVADVPEDVMVYSPMMDLVLGRLTAGETVTLKTFDPISFSASEVRVRAIGHETILLGAAETNALRLEIEMLGAMFRAWVDADGRLLRQETPMGWTLEACTAEEAVQFSSSGSAPDILRAAAVSVVGTIRNPRQARSLRVLFSGWTPELAPLEIPRQRVLLRERDVVEMEIAADKIPSEKSAGPPPEANDLAATLFIQSDDPKIRRQARAIRGALTNEVEIVLAVHDWVHQNVAKSPTVSLPSALDVLRQMEGDCNEHTYLFVALCRALGIPARIRVGLVFMDGRFYYHAWPAVWTYETWWELDPTLGQHAVDATHVALLEGELAEQVKLIGIIGRAQARILDEDS